MSAKYVTEQRGDVTIVDAVRRITLGEGSSALRELLRELVEKGSRKFVLNVAGVNYIDSSGIGEMVAGQGVVLRMGGNIKLVALNKRVRDLLQITKLYEAFSVHDTTEQAVRDFQQS